MDPANLKAQFQPQLEEPRLLSFPHLPDDAKYEDGTPILNKYSSTLTRGHDFPGAQAMLYAAGVPNEKMMKTAPQVGIASVWWEGNPCKPDDGSETNIVPVHDLGKTVKQAVEKQGMLGWQYGTIGVSDAITIRRGGEGMRFSLQTREIIADSIETITCAQFHDANISIPGCDKNMPGVVVSGTLFGHSP
ncbi:dihydroxy-acid and 6-phosphogluconate dehydratase [Aureobasidium sp. EXF-8845]|nr:dihydroxy-acid and 6-phosphogluconate dehydratase [Aureobasidium sp. EXF-8845]